MRNVRCLCDERTNGIDGKMGRFLGVHFVVLSLKQQQYAIYVCDSMDGIR